MYPAKTFTLWEALCGLIVCISALSVLLLALDHFDPLLAMSSGFAVFCGACACFSWRVVLPRRTDMVLLTLLFLAFAVRSDPSLWLMGRQDQGLYVNIAAHYLDTGSPFVTDAVREKLPESLKPVYDQEQVLYKRIADSTDDLKGEYPHISGNRMWFAMFLPGLYIKNLEQSEYVFQFYPLHPLWMSLTASLFGKASMVWIVALFGTATVGVFYLLAQELSGGHRVAGFFAGLFLALNPLHAYFSQFPTTEVLFLFFTSSGFLCLARWLQPQVSTRCHERNRVLLILSAGLFFCSFMTRMTGFMYAPLFLLLAAMAPLAHRLSRAERLQLSGYGLGVVVLYGVTLWYGLVYSRPYVLESFSIVWLRITTSSLLHVLPYALAVVVCATGIALWLGATKNINIKSYSAPLLLVWPRWILLCLLTVSATIFAFKSSNSEFVDISNLRTVYLYVSPILMITLVIGLADIRFLLRPITGMIILFLILFTFTNTILLNETTYHYYYARYQLSELVPFYILIAAVYVAFLYEQKLWQKTASVLAVTATIIYFAFWLGPQFQGSEAEGAVESIDRVTAELNQDDMLLTTFDTGSLVTPLKFFYNVNTLYLPNPESLPQWDLAEFVYSEYGDIYFLTNKVCSSPLLELVEDVAFSEKHLEHATTIPSSYWKREEKLYLYRVNSRSLRNALKIILPEKEQTENFWADLIWTKDISSLVNIDYPVQDSETELVCETLGWSPYFQDIDTFKLRIFANNNETPLHFKRRNHTQFIFALPQNLEHIEKLIIKAQTFVPQSLGINDDTRELGAALHKFIIQ